MENFTTPTSVTKVFSTATSKWLKERQEAINEFKYYKVYFLCAWFVVDFIVLVVGYWFARLKFRSTVAAKWWDFYYLFMLLVGLSLVLLHLLVAHTVWLKEEDMEIPQTTIDRFLDPAIVLALIIDIGQMGFSIYKMAMGDCIWANFDQRVTPAQSDIWTF